MTEKISTLIIAALIVVVLASSIANIIGLFVFNKPQMLVGEDSQKLKAFNDTFLKYNEFSTNVNILGSSLNQTVATESGSFGTLDSLYKTAWQTIKTLPAMLGFIGVMFGGVNTILPQIPWYAVGAISLIITIIIIFAILGAIFQREF